MKKFMAIILSAAMLVGMVGCSTDTNSDTDSISESKEYDDSDVKEEDKSVLNGLFGEKEFDVTAVDNAEEKAESETTAEEAVVEDKLISEDLENGQYRYDEYENHIEIVKYLLDAPAVEIPSEIDGKPVTVIGPSAFEEKMLKTLIISEGVTTIGDKSFYNCVNLISVTVPSSVQIIGWFAFADTPWLEVQDKPLIINNILVDYSSASGDIIIPDGVTNINAYAFIGCVNLKSVHIPNSVRSIGEGAFQLCISLTEVEISNGVTAIGENVFDNCTALVNIDIPDSVIEIGENAFRGTSWLDAQAQPVIINDILVDYSSASGKVVIPDNVISIAGGAFFTCTNLTEIIIPDSVEKIGNRAFSNCSSLTSITIPDSVEKIGNHAFRGCSSLTSITIPDSVTSIEWNAFSNCSSLTSVNIPDNVTYIGRSAFSNCLSLTNITIPNSVTSIGYKAFADCSSLTNVTIPNSVTEIGDSAFSNCPNLTDITIPERFNDRYDEIFGT